MGASESGSSQLLICSPMASSTVTRSRCGQLPRTLKFSLQFPGAVQSQRAAVFYQWRVNLVVRPCATTSHPSSTSRVQLTA